MTIMSVRLQNQATPSVNPLSTPFIGGLLQRACACGNHTMGGGCEGCKKNQALQRTSLPDGGRNHLDQDTRPLSERRFGGDFSQVRVHGRASTAIQPKLVIGDSADRLELEADAVAEQVMRMASLRHPEEAVSEPGPLLRGSKPSSDRERLVRRQIWNPYSIDEGLVEEREEEGQTGELVQAKAVSDRQPGIAPATVSRIEALQAGGGPLSTPVRTFMERRFGRDFRAVQVHTGSAAEAAAAMVNARAFSIGRTMVFGVGQYAPETESGRRLIAHELTHVVQQGGAPRMPATGMQTSVYEPTAESGLQKSGVRQAAVPGSVAPSTTQDSRTIRRVKWYPNTATGKTSFPWGSGPNGDVLTAVTDAGTAIDIWRPHDGTTYWCHGYTFGGKSAKGGPYSLWGSDVPTVLRDDGWRQTYSCMAQPKDVLIFWDDRGILTHSGIIRKVSTSGGRVNDTTSTLESKWGNGPHNTSSWETNAKVYGSYRSYSKSPLTGVCSGKGTHEL